MSRYKFKNTKMPSFFLMRLRQLHAPYNTSSLLVKYLFFTYFPQATGCTRLTTLDIYVSHQYLSPGCIVHTALHWTNRGFSPRSLGRLLKFPCGYEALGRPLIPNRAGIYVYIGELKRKNCAALLLINRQLYSVSFALLTRFVPTS